MRERYKEICRLLNVGHWQINFKEKQIQFDHHLQEQLQLKHPAIDFDSFFNYVIPSEKETVKTAINRYPESLSLHSFFSIRNENVFYLLEAVLNEPISKRNKIVSAEGYIKIINKNQSALGSVLKQSLNDIYTSSAPQFENHVLPTDKELYFRISQACQTAQIYPFTWNLDKNLFEFTIFENNDVIHKFMSLPEFAEFIYTDDRQDAIAGLELFASKETRCFKFKFRSSYFEKERWFEMSGEVYDTLNDSISSKAIGVLSNITESVIAQENQGKHKQLLLEAKKEIELAIADRNLALDNLNTALVYMNKDFVVQWNSMKTMRGILGKNAYAVGEQCYKSTFNKDTPCLDCPVVRLFNSKKPEMHRIERNREILEVMANPVFDENKELIGGVLKLDKITERVKQENLIKELNTLMGAILNHIPVYLYVKDPNNDFKYLYWNKALAESLRIPSSRVVGHTDDEILSNKKEARLARENDLELLQSRGRIYSIEEYQDSNEDIKIVSSLKTLIPAPNGKLPWILGISWDITELKKNEKELIYAKEKAEESNRLKSAFLANMSHEIRTPLNAIVGFSDLLSETEDNEDKVEYIDIIKNNNELLLQLISDILDLSKIEARSLDFVYEMVDIFDLVNQAVSAGNVNPVAKVPVVLDKHEADCYLYTDRNRTHQVLSNFINNALKFTSQGDIKVGYHKTNQGEIKFYVSDTGTGIETNQLNTVFERFVKLDNFKQGTGLGLSICKSIVEELKGSIGAESELGKGSYFWFTLPYNRDGMKNNSGIGENQRQQKRIVSKIQVRNELNDKPTILVAEDLDSNYKLVDKSLRSAYNLVRAYNGKEAIELYNKLKPDIILMDVMMPEMDGLQATREIRQKDQQIPIIAFSAYSYNTNDEKARKAGCDDFIAKPITANKLREKINAYIQFPIAGGMN